MSKPVILFVDDEPNILSGLRRLTHAQREHWDIRFAEGGLAAIEALKDGNVDVIISDMRMPMVDGAGVMEAAASIQPPALRVILSGEADLDMTFRTVGYSHQFLSKPCDAKTLFRAVNVPLALKQRLKDTPLADRAGDLGRLWTPQVTAQEFSQVWKQEGLDAKALAMVAAKDPALMFRILQLSNSAYFGARVATSSLRTAIEELGIGTLKTLFDRGRLMVRADRSEVDPQAAMRAKIAQKLALAAEAPRSFVDCAYAIGIFFELAELLREPEDPPLTPEVRALTSAYMCAQAGLPDILVLGLEKSAQIDQSLSAELQGAMIWKLVQELSSSEDGWRQS